jgi:hypothetical protein
MPSWLKNKIIVRLSGGLGNQLFQYAHARALAKEKGLSLGIDTSYYKNQSKRSYRMDNLKITAKTVCLPEAIFHKFFYPSTYIVGEFQDEKNFLAIADIIENEFYIKEKLPEKQEAIVSEIQKTNSVSVHIRRTDYLTKQHRFVVLGQKYYEEAMKIISEKVAEPRFFFFSDDIEWVKKNIKHPDNSVFLKNKDFEDMHLMSLCKHNITANSTFSWWAAWLNKNQNKIVITPQRWFSDNTSIAIPETWQKI